MEHCLENDTPCDEFVVHMQGMRCGCTLQSFRHGVGFLSRSACCRAALPDFLLRKPAGGRSSISSKGHIVLSKAVHIQAA